MNRRCLFSVALFLIALLPERLAAQYSAPPAASATPSWTGRYTGAGLELELKQTAFGGLSGVLTFEGKIYLATARPDGEKLTGSFRAGAESFPYEITRNGDEFRFVTGGTEYVLRRAGGAAAAPANPLARRTPAAPAISPALPPAGAPVTSTMPSQAASVAKGRLVQVSLGYSFRVPEGWTSTETPEGVMLLPAGVTFNPNRNDNPEVYLGILRDDYDPSGEAQAVRQISAGFAQGGGSGGQRQSARFGSRAGAIYRWEVRDPASGRLAAFDVFLTSEGRRGFLMIAAGEKARVRANDDTVRQIMASVDFTAPSPAAGGPLADTTPLAQRWLAKLRGKLVRQFWASQGMSSEKKHWLNADGTYAYASSSMVSIDVSGASALSTGRDDSRGHWRIRDLGGEVFLEVRYLSGKVARMPITENNTNWFLNGEKAFADNP